MCQFCGQELTKDAHKLLDFYQQAFDKAFDQHETKVKQQLTKAIVQVNQLPIDEVRVMLAKNTAVFSEYTELQKNETYTYALQALAEHEDKINTTFSAINKQLPDALKRIDEAVSKKKFAPNVVFGEIDEAEICSLENQVSELVSEYKKWIEVCNEEIVAFKKDSNLTVLQERLQKIEAEGKSERLNNNRIRLEPQCKEYQVLSSEIDTLTKEIDALEEQLQNNQSAYLETFFDSLNYWFRRFGSHDFKLERGESRHGHTPIYFLRVKYKDHAIDENVVSQVFSESDRRALALAVFWTLLQSLPESTLAEQIVVLDDPLTSFDDHRVTAVHSELAANAERVRQIIVLSHYRHDIEMFFRTFRDQPDARLLILVAGGSNGTDIKVGDPREFLLNEHQRAHERMTSFACGDINDLAFSDLRIFFEYELDSRFAAQIVQQNLGALKLGEKIDKLYEFGVIAETIKNECHTWRKVLNPSHHIWTDADLENQRNTVRDFLEFVYNKLIREQ